MANVFGSVCFISSKQGKTGLSASLLVDIYQISKTTMAASLLSACVSGSEIGGGFYGISASNVSPDTYYYLGMFRTTDTTVDQQHIGAWLDDPTNRYTWTDLRASYLDQAISTPVALAGSAISASSVTTGYNTNIATTTWASASRDLTDKTNYGLSASALTEISANVPAASSIWSYTTRALSSSAIAASTITADFVDIILDEQIEGTYTMRQLLRLFGSVLMGKASGGGTASITFRDINDSVNRVVATVDSVGNRTAITLTGS